MRKLGINPNNKIILLKKKSGFLVLREIKFSNSSISSLSSVSINKIILYIISFHYIIYIYIYILN